MSEVVAIVRTPDMIAAEINGIKEHTRQIVLMSSIEIGRRLVEAKDQMEHGAWGKWLKESVDYSHSTANNLMKLYNELGDDKIATLGNLNFENLSYTKSLALLGVPADEREQFVADHNVDELSARELQQAIADKKAADERAAEAERIAEEARQQAEVERKQREKVEKESGAHAKEVARLLKALEDAKAGGDSEEVAKLREELETKKNELSNSLAEKRRLEQELAEKPVDVPAIVEKVPDEVQRELDELREKLAQITKDGGTQQGKPDLTKFRVYWKVVEDGFNDLLDTLDEISDDETKAKLAGAVQTMIDQMTERLE